MRLCRSTACLALVLAACGTASAQDHGPVGITMAFPTSIGAIFHATDKVAIRPEFTFTQSSTDSSPVEATTWSVGTGVSALFYLSSRDRVQTYVAPRFSYAHADTSIAGGIVSDNTSDSTGFSGSFGAEYSPSARFSVYGEAGIALHAADVEVASVGDRNEESHVGDARGSRDHLLSVGRQRYRVGLQAVSRYPRHLVRRKAVARLVTAGTRGAS